MGQVIVTLNSRTYRLGCGDGEEARLQELSSYLAAKVDAIRTEVGQVGEDRLLVMAALLIADELFEARERSAEPAEARRPSRRNRSTGARSSNGSEPEANADEPADRSAVMPIGPI